MNLRLRRACLRRTLAVVLTAAAITAIPGCNGMGSLVPTAVKAGTYVGSHYDSVRSNGAGRNEVLTARPRHVSIHCVTEGQFEKITFSAHGRASGPYKGTFVAYGSGDNYKGFSESFTITSAGQTLSGTLQGSYADIGLCGISGRELTYTVGSKTGKASADLSEWPKHFAETLYRL
jgi:hypothetical protein